MPLKKLINYEHQQMCAIVTYRIRSIQEVFVLQTGYLREPAIFLESPFEHIMAQLKILHSSLKRHKGNDS